jgi:hypothetical protein
VGADIFFRTIQIAWEDLQPSADCRALDAAGRLGLPKGFEQARHARQRR